MAIFLILSIIFSVMFATCYKIAVHNNCNLQAVNTWNYIGAVITILIFMLIKKHFPFSWLIFAIAVASGFSAYFSTYTFFLHIKQGQLSTSWTIISLSVAFPVLASILIWNEQPSAKQIAAMIIIVFAFILVGKNSSKAVPVSKKSYIYLLIAFFLSGLSAVLYKTISELNMQSFVLFYTLILYSTGMIIGLPFVAAKKTEPYKADIGIGVMMGFSGAVSTIFLMKSLELIPGIIVFPSRSMGNLILTAIISILIWKDKLSISQWIGMTLSLAAIWLII